MPEASVIISTYERPEHLARCLQAFRYQTTDDFELVIADDGSGPDTLECIQLASKDHPVAIRHAWQGTGGFARPRP